MAAYMIVFAKINDRARFMAEYGAPTAALIGQYGGEYIIRGPGVESLEGGLFDGTSAVVSKWPDRASLDAFYNSEAYAPLKAVRKEFSEAHIMVFEEPA
ncbi:MAG: DUF1330 domain-containing protein [Pseudomonadota bacterium]